MAEYKYVIFEDTTDSVTRRFPVIFPATLIHSDIADMIVRNMGREHHRLVSPVSAGVVSFFATDAVGHSETLGLKSGGDDDRRLINTFTYTAGVETGIEEHTEKLLGVQYVKLVAGIVGDKT